jgi:XTP/dITP diphosphohydrolase
MQNTQIFLVFFSVFRLQYCQFTIGSSIIHQKHLDRMVHADSTAVPLPLAVSTAVPTIAAPQGEREYFAAFVELVRILRRECPWDRKQTHTSLAPLLLEEVYETIDAIEANDTTEIAKELGDILLHVVMNAVIAEETDAFSLAEIMRREFDKLVSRHPHVFAGSEADTPDAVKRTWEQVKMREGRTSVLEGVPNTLPALLRAHRIQEKVAAVGFDWRNEADVWEKVEEELSEFRTARAETNTKATEEEFGDVLFSLVNASRFAGMNAEQALQNANTKFMRRFRRLEDFARAEGTSTAALSLEEMDTLWNRVKVEERMPI